MKWVEQFAAWDTQHPHAGIVIGLVVAAIWLSAIWFFLYRKGVTGEFFDGLFGSDGYDSDIEQRSSSPGGGPSNGSEC